MLGRDGCSATEGDGGMTAFEQAGEAGGRSTGGPFFPKPLPLYNETWRGVFGEFGSGSGLQAFFVQTTVSPLDLRKVSLVKDMKGSERWRVRDLFQREVDEGRVGDDLVPYLADRERIKFFNSLILTVLPVDRSNGRLLDKMPRVAEKTVVEDGQEWLALERDELFRVRRPKAEPQFAELQWNSDRTVIVAIDGQHRLSALKRLTANWTGKQRAEAGDAAGSDGGVPVVVPGSLLEWSVPVVVVSFRAAAGRREPPSVLEVVRSIFVDINNKAQRVSEARRILLDDTSVNSVAAQELLERAHSNDLKPQDERKPETAPLLLFDWRGVEHHGKAQPAPSAVKTVVEIREWFKNYILGEDFCESQADVLDMGSDQRLIVARERGSLDYEAAGLIRKRLRRDVIPALGYLLENFEPYRRYIEDLRRLEKEHYSGHGLQQHAFDRLRFGSSGEESSSKFEVDDIQNALVVEIKRAQDRWLRPAMPVDHDIGLRGIVQSFGHLREQFACEDWLEFAQWFTEALNWAYAEDWFDAEHGGRAHSHLCHVVLGHAGTVVNYRVEDAGKALGPYVSLLVGTYGAPPEHWGANWCSQRNKLLHALGATVFRGHKKEVRPQLREEYPNGGKELTVAVNEEARKRAGRQMRRFERVLEKIAEQA